MRGEHEIAWLEFVPENFLTHGGARQRLLEQCAERWTMVPHGVALSVGGPDPLAGDYVRRLKNLARKVKAPYFSDHLCFSSAHGYAFHDLLPLPFSDEAADWAAARARMAAEALELPLLLENVTYYAEMPGSRLSEGAFLRAVLETSDSYLLLDVNNAYVNARNHDRDPWLALLELPLERTRQIHLAGHTLEGERLLDDHGSAVSEPVWELYRRVIERIGPVPTLIEWDTNTPPLERLLQEANRAGSVLYHATRTHDLSRARDELGAGALFH